MKRYAAQGMEQFSSFLKAKNCKATPQRVAVHQAMMALVHASADMVADFVGKNSDTRVTVASVYNTLSKMCDLGVYSRRLSADNKMYFDLIPFNHVHLYDYVNHEFADIDDKGLLEMVESAIKGRRFKGYKVESVDVQIVCKPTRRRKV